jgi:2-C-methyl-D-erythritol 4-phosphate cytidylyltransferase
MKKYAVIVAGGFGTRMGKSLPKQFMLLREKPLLYYTINAFLEAFTDIRVILVLPLDYMEMGREIIDAYFEKERFIVTAGGNTRFQSVQNGLVHAEEDSIIFVHDGVRCLVTPDLIRRCHAMALKTGTAVPVVPAKDSIRLITEEGNEAMERDKVVVVQTPQVFHGKILKAAYQIDYKDRFTDEASVVEAYGVKISLVEGEETNIKITLPQDLVIADYFLPHSSHSTHSST